MTTIVGTPAVAMQAGADASSVINFFKTFCGTCRTPSSPFVARVRDR
jgi:hypothetical protein